MANALTLPPNAVAFVDNGGRLSVAGRASLEKTIQSLETQIAGVSGLLDGSIPVGNAETLGGQNGGFYLDRANHVGTQTIATVSGLQSALDGKVGPFTDPNADRILFWDDSAGVYAFLQTGTNLTITGTTIDAASGPSTQGKHAIYIAAGAMRPSVTGGCAALAAIASAANQPDIVTLDFDATTQEFAQFSLVMPKKWNEGTVTFIPHWSHASTSVNFGVVWGLQAVAVSNDDAIAVAFGTEQTSTDTGGTTNDYYAGPESAAITIAGTPQPEDMVFFRLNRNPAAGSDTMAIDARLHGITLFITTNADTDA